MTTPARSAGLPAASASATRRADARWEAAVDEHQVSLAAFLDVAGGLSDEAWARPWGEGKWTPAEIAEHLALLYEAMLRELREGRGIAPRVSPLRQRILRWIVLPHVLFHRALPVKVRAPREVRPAAVRAGREELLRVLRELGERFEGELDRARRAGKGTLTHPFFGGLDPVRGMRFVAVHMEHHRRQVERAAKRS